MASNNNDILKERVELVAKIKKIQEEQGKEAAKLDKEYIKIKGRLQEILDIQRETHEKASNITGAIKSSVDEASSLSSVYRNVKTELDNQRKIQTSIAETIGQQAVIQGGLTTNQQYNRDLTESILSKYSEQADIATKISQLTDEDAIKRADLLNKQSDIGKSIKEEISAFDKRSKIAKSFLSMQSDIEESIKRQTDESIKLSWLTEAQKDSLEEQAKMYGVIQDKINAIGSSITTFFKKPATWIGGLIASVGHLEHKITDVNKELGFTVLDMNSAAKSAGLLSFIFDDTANTVKSLTNELGSLESATLSAQFNVGAISSLMGISNTEASQLVGHFARMNGGSTDIAADMIQTTKEYAKQNNVIPSDVLSDLAGSAEEFALFAKDGGKNMIEAATYARKLGTNMATLGNIAEGLLDFETSMTKELELGVMLGKNINLNKARQLAYDDDIAGATQEVLRQVGGIEAFNRMDYFQKKATADLLGVSVAELKKMADNQSRVGEMGYVVNEQFSKWKASLDMVTNKYLGHGIEVLGGWVATSAEVGANFSRLGLPIGKLLSPLGSVISGTGQILKNLWQMTGGTMIKGLSKVGSTLAGGLGDTKLVKGLDKIKERLFKGVGKSPIENVQENIKKSTTPNVKGKTGEGLKGLAGGLKEMGTGKVLFGALNLIPTALGMVAMIPALPTMAILGMVGVSAGIGLKSIGEGLKSMGGTKQLLGTAVLVAAGIGFTAMTAGSLGLGAVALLGMPAGIGLKSLGLGLKSIGGTKQLLGASVLAAAGLGFTIMTPGIIGLGAIALLGIPAGAGLIGLSNGLKMLGNTKVLAGTLVLGLLSLSMIGMGYAMKLFAENASGILPAIGALIAFGVAAALIGSFLPLILLGSLGIAALGASLIVFGFGLSSIVPSLEKFGKLLTTVFGGISILVQSFGTALVNVFSGISSAIQSVGTTLTNIFSGIGTSITNVLGGIGSMIQSFGNTILSIFSGIGSLLQSFGNVFVGLGSVITTVFSGIGSLLQSFGNVFVGLGSVITTVFSGISTSITNVLGGIGSVIQSVGNIIINVLGGIGSFVETFGNTLTNVFSGIGSFIQSFGNVFVSIGTSISSVFGGISSAIKSIGNVITSVFSGMATLVTAVSTGFATLMDSVTPEKVGNMFSLGPALISAGAGLAAFSLALGAASIGNLFGGGILSTLGELTEMSAGLATVAVSLTAIGAGIGMISENLAKLDTEKLESLKNFSTTISVGGAMTGIANSVSGMIDSVSAVISGESLSTYETTMIDKMDELINAVKTNKDVYIDKEKITKVLAKSMERRTENLIGLSVA